MSRSRPEPLDQECLRRHEDLTLRSILGGDVERLLFAFAWHHSPEGHAFWHEQYASGRMCPQARVAINRRLLRRLPT